MVFHNLCNYDSHFLIKQISKGFKGNIKIIPTNIEKYISFIKYVENTNIRFSFIDSLKFLNSSLEKLASYLSNDDKRILRKHFPDENQFNLLIRKGVFPYEYVTNMSVLNDTNLPSQNDFYNKMNDTHITNSDYMHALNVWNTFDCKNLGEYSDLYLKTDVLLLSDIFIQFRNTLLKSHALDICHYVTLPSYTFDAALKYTQVELELLTDIDKIMLFEKGIRGGLSQSSNRYAKANNKYMKDYDPSKETQYICYFDVNNLYGKSMCEYLPTGGFEWVDNLENFDLINIPENSEIGYILEVDLSYPETLHDTHKDFPFCPEKSTPKGSKQTKLLATLYDKKNYVLHYRNLQQALTHGLILTKIHRILKFNQSPWLKSYINLNNELRKKATNEFEKNLYKLLNNACFGKTMENVRKRVDIKLKNKFKGRYGAEALISKPNFHRRVVFDQDLVAIEMKQTSVTMDKPIYVGMCILELSKTIMYDFHYNHILPDFKDNVNLIYSDTDSYIYLFKKQNIYKYIKQNIHLFDTSDYEPNNVYGIPLKNRKVLGIMKDEVAGKIIREIVALRAKMYAYEIDNNNKKEECKRAKGIKKCVVNKTISFSDYLDCLENKTEIMREQRLFKSELHNVFTICQKKIALSAYDDKRYLIKNSKSETLPWGHKNIPKTDDQDMEIE